MVREHCSHIGRGNTISAQTKIRRIERETISGTEVIVIAEEMPNIKTTSFEVISGLVRRHFEDEQMQNLLFAD